MRKNHAYRPRLSEILEARAVPATLGVLTPTGLVGISVTLPGQIPTNSPQVKAAFTAFDQSYIKAVDLILEAPGSDGLVVPGRNQAAFVTAIEQSLADLAKQLVLSLNPSPIGSTVPTGSSSSADSQVVSAILGSGSTSLESQLLARGTSVLSLSVPGLSSTTTSSTAALVPNMVNTAEQVRPTVRVADGVGATTADLATISGPGAGSSRASEDVRAAFGGFLKDYFQAVQGVLLAPGSNGRVQSQANRAAFDARVAEALQSLELSLTTTLGRDPATSGLGPQLRSTIEGDGSASLKARLANLATPEASQAATVRDFTLGSTRAVAQVLSLLNGDIAKLLGATGR